MFPFSQTSYPSHFCHQGTTVRKFIELGDGLGYGIDIFYVVESSGILEELSAEGLGK